MKLLIEADRPISRDNLAKMVQHIFGDDCLHKSDAGPREMPHKVLQDSIDRSHALVEGIRERMMEKIEHVLKGA